MVFTKPIQQVRHYLKEEEKVINTRQIIMITQEILFIYQNVILMWKFVDAIV